MDPAAPVRLPAAHARSLVFDEDDVVANRRGELSEWQRQRIIRARELHRRSMRALVDPKVAVTFGVPDVSPAAVSDTWHVQIGGVRFAFDGGTAIEVDIGRPLLVFYTDLGYGSPAVLSAELADSQ